MNLLNSVILEGAMLNGVSENGVFYITYDRHTKVGDKSVTLSMHVKCVAEGQLLEWIKNKIKKDYRVRVVGRLTVVEGGLAVFVEHLEVKLMAHKEGKYSFEIE